MIRLISEKLVLENKAKQCWEILPDLGSHSLSYEEDERSKHTILRSGETMTLFTIAA